MRDLPWATGREYRSGYGIPYPGPAHGSRTSCGTADSNWRGYRDRDRGNFCSCNEAYLRRYE